MNPIVEVQSILDEQKEKLNEGDYLRLSNLLKSVYTNKEEQLWEVTYLLPKVDIVMTTDEDEPLFEGLNLVKSNVDLVQRKAILKSATKPCSGITRYVDLQRYCIHNVETLGQCSIYSHNNLSESASYDIRGLVWVLDVKPYHL